METRQERPFEGKRALIVGGSGGIGAALALALASRGASLLVHGGSSAEHLSATLAAAGAAAAANAAATGKATASVEGFLQGITAPRDLLDRLPRLGQIDILACAFGPFLQAAIHDTSVSDWESLALLDLALPGALASALVGGMARRGWGRILLFGGTRTDAIRAYSTNAAYAAAKTGLAVLAKSLAAEYSASGVAAYLLCPGLVETEYLPEAARAELAAKAPRGQLIKAAAVGEFAARLLADEPAIASGAVINLDSGLRF